MRARYVQADPSSRGTEILAHVDFDSGEPFDLRLLLPPDLVEPEHPLSGDALLAGLLLPAMKLGESLQIEAPVSPRLLRSTPRIQAMYRAWEPRLSSVKVLAEPRPDPPRSSAGRVGLFFSGGVDSSYSLARNRIDHPLNEDRIEELIVIHGNDIKLSDPRGRLMDQKFDRIRRLAESLEVAAHRVSTNVQELTDRLSIPWGSLAHGACLTGLGLSLQDRYRRLYIAPCSGSWHKLMPTGSHPLLDPLWSTETLEFVHDGCEATRLERIALLARQPDILRGVHVCWDRESLDLNCGHCSKCLLLAVGLQAVAPETGIRPPEIDLEALATVKLVIPAEVDWCSELIDALERPEDADLREALIQVRDRFRDYFERLQRAARHLRRLAPGSTPFVLIDEEGIREKLGAGIPFLERDGVFAGNPPDDAAAIAEIERQRAAGVPLLAIWWCCFWILDHYAGLRRHLDAHYPRIFMDDSLWVYDLRGSA